MKRITPHVAALTAFIYACSSLGCSTPPRTPPTATVTRSSSELVAQFQGHKISNYTLAELNDYALALFVAGRFEDGLKVARQGYTSSKTDEQKAAFKLHESQLLAALGLYEEAGRAALEGSRMDPRNKLLVAFRIAHFQSAGNKLQAETARDHLRQLDPEFDRNPVIEPATAALVITLVTVLTQMVIRIYQEKYAADIAKARIARLYAAADTSKFTSPSLGSSTHFSDFAPAE